MSAEQGRRLIVGKGGKRQEIYSRVMLVRIYGTDRREPMEILFIQISGSQYSTIVCLI